MLLQMEALVVILWIAQPIGKLGMAKTWLSGLHRTHYAIQIQPKTTSAKALWWIQIKAQNNSRGRMLLQFISVNSGCGGIQSPCALYAWPLNGFPFSVSKLMASLSYSESFSVVPVDMLLQWRNYTMGLFLITLKIRVSNLGHSDNSIPL